MKAKWLLLTKIHLLGMFDFNKMRKGKDPRLMKRTIGGGLLFVLVLALLLFYAVSIAMSFAEGGFIEKVPGFSVALASFFILLFSFFQGGARLFATKDFDQLMAMPLKKSDLVISRLIAIYLPDLAFALGVIAPMLIVYFVHVGFSAVTLLLMVMVTLLTPVIPLFIGCVLSTLFAALTAGFRYKGLLESALSLILVAAIVAGSFLFSFSSASDTDPSQSLYAMYDMIIGRIYLPALLVDITISGEQIWGVFAFAGISLAACALFVALFARFFFTINALLRRQSAGRAYRRGDVRASTPFRTLVGKEFRRLVSCSSYLVNGICGAVMLVLFSVGLIVFAEVFRAQGIEIGDLVQNLNYIVLGAALFCYGTTCPAASALSLEGSSRSALFSMPVSANKILLAKALPTFLINAISGLVFAVCAGIGLRMGALDWIFAILSVPLFSAFVALSGILLNYKMPNYDWKTEIQVVKNSIPVLIETFGVMALSCAICILCYFFGWIVFVILLALVVLADAVFLYLIQNAKLYA